MSDGDLSMPLQRLTIKTLSTSGPARRIRPMTARIGARLLSESCRTGRRCATDKPTTANSAGAALLSRHWQSA